MNENLFVNEDEKITDIQSEEITEKENAEEVIEEDTKEAKKSKGYVCCICRMKTSSEPAVLAMSGYGNPRYICDQCEALLDTATKGTDYEEISRVGEEISKRLSQTNCEDIVVLNSLDEILKDAAERAKAIKNGTYDFSEDTTPDESEFDEVPEELLESEEDRLLDEKEEKTAKVVENIFSWVAAAIFVGAIIYFVMKFIL